MVNCGFMRSKICSTLMLNVQAPTLNTLLLENEKTLSSGWKYKTALFPLFLQHTNRRFFYTFARFCFLLKLLDDNKDHKLESSIFYIFCFSCGTLFGGRNSILSMSRHFLEGEQNTSVYHLLCETNSVTSSIFSFSTNLTASRFFFLGGGAK